MAYKLEIRPLAAMEVLEVVDQSRYEVQSRLPEAIMKLSKTICIFILQWIRKGTLYGG
jgi:hypothetical protein